MKSGICKLMVCFAVLACSNTAAAQDQQYSQLWGKNGELWNKKRIPDFSKAGYRQGKVPIPDYPVQSTVETFGAKGDDLSDDTQAFRKAIAGCKSNTTLLIPAGRYILSDTLLIRSSRICIRGAGQGKTILAFKKGLEQLYPDYGKEFKDQTNWSWSGGMVLFTSNVHDSGIENLSIQFPDSVYKGHDFHERAYNAIGFSAGAHDSWARNIQFTGADVLIWIEKTAHHITAENWLADFGPVRAAQDISGHHALNIYGGYNLIRAFDLKGKFVHDLSVEGENSVYNVFSEGTGKDLAIDHHNHEQHHNLFTNLDAGIGSRLYRSGGIAVPRGISSNETYWNIRSQKPVKYCNEFDDATAHSKNNVCVGLNTLLPSALGDQYNNWFETVAPVILYPQDLYQAQSAIKH